MTRNLSAGPRKEGLQDTISHSAEFGPTICTTLFFFSDLHLLETLPSQILVLVSPLSAPHCVCHPHDPQFSGFLSLFSVHLLAVSAPIDEQAISRGYPGTTSTT